MVEAIDRAGEDQRERLLRVLSAATFLIFFQVYMVAPLIPRLAAAFAVSDQMIGLIVPAYMIPYGVSTLFYGLLSDRLGRKPMILAGLLLCAATLPAIPTLASPWLLFPVSALFGLGVAIVTPSTTALVADLVKGQRMGSAMGVFGTIWDTGEAGGPILAGFLIASLGYSPAFTMIALLMAVVALVFAVLVRDPQAVQWAGMNIKTEEKKGL